MGIITVRKELGGQGHMASIDSKLRSTNTPRLSSIMYLRAWELGNWGTWEFEDLGIWELENLRTGELENWGT
ncbi:hypothetical protein SBOR_0230 [Sclerotinia borealis F-4128]|uniref:Uncharacterized protein n=1 Tax=Sclerotinia borealis (strain F-4128) TaxID=1432307 RepID=W9CXL9_SCLBF|nr:hypothetical protein SBOR_0230 [Sclerotinia borealis F-4128]